MQDCRVARRLFGVEVGAPQPAGKDGVCSSVVAGLQECGVDLQRYWIGYLGQVVALDVSIELGGPKRGLHLVRAGIDRIEDPVGEGEEPVDADAGLLVVGCESSRDFHGGGAVAYPYDAQAWAFLRGKEGGLARVAEVRPRQGELVGLDVLVLQPIPSPCPEARRAGEDDPVVGISASCADAEGVDQELGNRRFLAGAGTDPALALGRCLREVAVRDRRYGLPVC